MCHFMVTTWISVILQSREGFNWIFSWETTENTTIHVIVSKSQLAWGGLATCRRTQAKMKTWRFLLKASGFAYAKLVPTKISDYIVTTALLHMCCTKPEGLFMETIEQGWVIKLAICATLWAARNCWTHANSHTIHLGHGQHEIVGVLEADKAIALGLLAPLVPDYFSL